MHQVCGRCGVPSCVVLSTQRLRPAGDATAAAPTSVRFCVLCGCPMSSAPRCTAPTTASVSLSTLYAAIAAVKAEHAREKEALEVEVAALRATVASRPTTPAYKHSMLAVTALSSIPTSSSDTDALKAAERAPVVLSPTSTAAAVAAAGRSRSRSPSIILPVADAYVSGVTAAPPTVYSPPPRCSRTLPRRSCSYDSEVDLPFRVPAVHSGALVRSCGAGFDAGMVADATQPSTRTLPSGFATTDAEETAQRRVQQQAYERLRDALLQQL